MIVCFALFGHFLGLFNDARWYNFENLPTNRKNSVGESFRNVPMCDCTGHVKNPCLDICKEICFKNKFVFCTCLVQCDTSTWWRINISNQFPMRIWRTSIFISIMATIGVTRSTVKKIVITIWISRCHPTYLKLL